MSQGLMTLIGGVLVFLAAIIPIVTSIVRSATQEGVQPTVIMGASFIFLGIIAYWTGIIGLLRKWNGGLIYVCVLISLIFYTTSFVVFGGAASRIEIAGFSIALFAMSVLVAAVFSTIPKV